MLYVVKRLAINFHQWSSFPSLTSSSLIVIDIFLMRKTIYFHCISLSYITITIPNPNVQQISNLLQILDNSGNRLTAEQPAKLRARYWT